MFSPTDQPSAATRANRARIGRVWGWGISGGLHSLLVGLAIAELLLGLAILPSITSPATKRQVELSGILEHELSKAEPAVVDLVDLADKLPTAAELAHEDIRVLAETIEPALEAELLNTSSTDSSDAASWVASRVQTEIAAAERLSASENIERLEMLTATLDRVSTEESVSAVTSQLSRLLGTRQRAEVPAAEPVAGEFDLNTAQLYEVKRTDDGDGDYEYVGILLDADGRTMETPLDAAEGENLYRTLELIKANPLLERIYRKVVMSLMDEMLKGTAADAGPAP